MMALAPTLLGALFRRQIVSDSAMARGALLGHAATTKTSGDESRPEVFLFLL